MRIILILAALAVALPAAGAGAQPDGLPRVIPEQQPPIADVLAQQLLPVTEKAGDLRERIGLALTLLERVSQDSPAELEAEVNRLFADLSSQVQDVVSLVAPNSELRNALSRAREQAIVFRADLLRREDLLGVDAERVAELDEAIERFQSLGQELDLRRDLALEHLFLLSRRQTELLDDLRLNSILEAQTALEDVVAGLGELANSIAELQVPDDLDLAIEN